MDQLDAALIEALREHPRVGDLELSRITKVARATVQSRLAKMERSGVITGYGPDIDLVAAGHPVLAFVTLEIAQGSLDAVTEELDSLPNVLEAYVTSGTADVVCKIAATSHEDLQTTLLHISRSGFVVRSTSVIVLSELVRPRVLPMLKKDAVAGVSRAPAYRA
jgi:DNA-binding Lrp family transcriptional regulator